MSIELFTKVHATTRFFRKGGALAPPLFFKGGGAISEKGGAKFFSRVDERSESFCSPDLLKGNSTGWEIEKGKGGNNGR